MALSQWFPLISSIWLGYFNLSRHRRDMVSTLWAPRSTQSPRKRQLVQGSSPPTLNIYRTSKNCPCTSPTTVIGSDTLSTFFYYTSMSLSLQQSICMALCSSISHLNAFYSNLSTSNPIPIQIKLYMCNAHQHQSMNAHIGNIMQSGKQILIDGQLRYNFYFTMDQLLNSRLSREQSPSKLENLSPDKFGKGAYANLSYTPSKLADNVLFKEVTTFKKIEEESSKVRESTAYNSLLKDRLSQMQEERDGIEQTLTQQISMYKKMLNENQVKHEQRLKDIQKGFNEEIQKIILAKEEEVKYVQSEKELLQSRINELQIEVSELKEQLDHGGSNFDELSRNHEKLEIHHKNICEKLEESERRAQQESKKAKEEYEQLSRKLYNTEVQFKGQLQKIQLQREREKENLQKLHKAQLQKIENKRLHEAMVKNQELKDLSATFQSQANRLNDIIASKERNIQALNNIINQQKEKYVNLTRTSTQEITNLVNEKRRFKEEIDTLNLQRAQDKQAYRELQNDSEREIASRDANISKLKDEIQLNLVTFEREKEQLSYFIDDLQKQNAGLKEDNAQLLSLSDDNKALCREIRNLKEILLQSSIEMEQCKEEFIRIGREKDLLSVKVRELGYENESLHRLKMEKEDQARSWRESYYLSRR